MPAPGLIICLGPQRLGSGGGGLSAPPAGPMLAVPLAWAGMPSFVRINAQVLTSLMSASVFIATFHLVYVHQCPIDFPHLRISVHSHVPPRLCMPRLSGQPFLHPHRRSQPAPLTCPCQCMRGRPFLRPRRCSQPAPLTCPCRRMRG